MRIHVALTLIVLSCPQWVRPSENGTPFSKLVVGNDEKSNVGRLPHIVGGVEAEPHSHPYLVALEVDNGPDEDGDGDGGTSICGGSLISDKWVLTAAHCVDSWTPTIKVLLGAHKYGIQGNTTQSGGVEKRIIHPLYKANSIMHDVALLKLNFSVRMDGRNIGVIKLPKVSQKDWSFWNYQANMVGWGKKKDDDLESSVGQVLRSTTSRVVTNFYCAVRFLFILVRVTGDHICTSGWWGKGTCDGDSGGPLTTLDSDGQRILIGVTSFGHYKCETWWPSVYARVTSYLDWIHNNTGIALRT